MKEQFSHAAMKNVRAHVFIEGRVQGVFYRTWTLRQAQGLRLTGWVRNIGDGRVESVFEGSKKKVNKMIDKCKKGSRFARVTHVDVNWENATGEFKRFEIHYLTFT